MNALIQRAAECGGWLPFDQFMALALSHPTHGYYSRVEDPFGASGDFITAPMLGPWLAAAIVQREPAVRGADGILELGAGRGDLAADLLLEAHRAGGAPRAYQILETSPALIERQRGHIAHRLGRVLHAAEAADLLGRISWIDRIPVAHRGLIVANEVADALPVRLMEWSGRSPTGAHEVLEWGLRLLPAAADADTGEHGQLEWSARPAPPALAQEVARRAEAAEWRGYPWAPGHRLEICPALAPWGRTLAESVVAGGGSLLLIDYGYEEPELDHPDRARGTLAGHRQHRRIDDWAEIVAAPGEVDITAHVNFTDLAAPMAELALDLSLKTQAAYLLEGGVLDLVQSRWFAEAADDGQTAPDERGRWQALAGLQTLLGDTGMGQSFLVLAARSANTET